jgi:hypothetical protein
MKTSAVQETADLSIFKVHPENREVEPGHVNDLAESLKEHELFEIRPILVDRDMCVLDGQHRLAAAKELGIPVKYQIVNDPNASQLIYILNAKAQKAWKRGDYLHYWCARRNENYLKLRAFMKAKGTRLPETLAALGWTFGGGCARDFRDGKYIFPDSLDEIDAVFEKAQRVIEYVETKALEKSSVRFVRGPHFGRALFSFLGQKNVDAAVFLQKLPYRLELIKACTTLQEYTRLFVAIYNWKNKDPIPAEAF